MNHSSKILKLKARTVLMGKYPPSVATMISMLALSAILNWLLSISGFSMAGDTLQKVCYVVMNIVILLLEGLFGIGLSYFFLQMALGKPFFGKMLFYCFRHDPDRFILATALRGGLVLLSFVPAFVCFLSIPDLLEASTDRLLLLLFLILLGFIFNLVIQVFLGQCYYILLENPDCGVIESLRSSVDLIRGRKLQAFLLQLTYLGFSLLELGTMGVGALWIQPYAESIKLQFYFDLTGRDPLAEAAAAQEKAEAEIHVWPPEDSEPQE